MTTDEAIEFVVADMAQRRSDWTEDDCRKAVEISRDSISANPELFVEAYAASVEHLSKEPL